MSASSAVPGHLTVSIVVHSLQPVELRQTLGSVQQALLRSRHAGVVDSSVLLLINNADNSTANSNDPQGQALQSLLDELSALPNQQLQLLSGHGNIGYGGAHNLVIREPGLWAGADAIDAPQYYLILNPDVRLEADALLAGLTLLQQETAVLAVSPFIRDGRGRPASGCKRYPAVLDLLLRGFAPGVLRRLVRTRLDHYSMAELPTDRASLDVPIISGCCMLFRGEVLRWLDGFDDRYFLYFEDFDLCLRAREYGQLAYQPAMRITHLGGRSARKGLRHIGWFGRSAHRFFTDHGWRWW